MYINHTDLKLEKKHKILREERSCSILSLINDNRCDYKKTDILPVSQI